MKKIKVLVALLIMIAGAVIYLPTTKALEGDTTQLSQVGTDYGIMKFCFSKPINGECATADVNNDGTINIIDAQSMLNMSKYDYNNDDKIVYSMFGSSSDTSIMMSTCYGKPVQGTCINADLDNNGVVEAVDNELLKDKILKHDLNNDDSVDLREITVSDFDIIKSCVSKPVAGICIKADLDNNNTVDIIDVQTLLNKDKYDTNRDGVINVHKNTGTELDILTSCYNKATSIDNCIVFDFNADGVVNIVDFQTLLTVGDKYDINIDGVVDLRTKCILEKNFISDNYGCVAGSKSSLKTTITDQVAYNFFKKALGSRANLLDANQATGTTGAWGFVTSEAIKADILKTQTETLNLFSSKAVPKDVLNWFRAKFQASSFNQTSKTGIEQATNARVKDLCAIEFTTEAKKALGTEYLLPKGKMTTDRRVAYRDELVKLSTLRKNAITAVMTEYKTCVNNLSPATKSITTDTCIIEKNKGINTAWMNYYGNSNDTSTTTPKTAYGVYSTYYKGAEDNYKACTDANKWNVPLSVQ
jgi:hypothetical protein